MKLHVGERLPGTGPPGHPGGYVVTGVLSETPWYGLYTGKKVLYNFDFTAKRPREADEKEWLDVYLRTVNYPRLDDPAYVAERRELARAEVRRVLGNRSSNLWPEPLDILEVPNSRDPFTFTGPPAPAGDEGDDTGEPGPVPGTEPVLVFARPQGEPLARWRQGVRPLALVLSVLAELLEFVHSAHRDGLLLNGLGPGAVAVDLVGRVHYLGSDMVVHMPPAGAAAGPAPWARFFPPERYPRGFSAPECFDPAAPRDRRTDLYAWAAVAYFVLTGDRPAQLALGQGQPWARFGEAQVDALTQALRAVPPALVRVWGEQLGIDGSALVKGWPRNFAGALEYCLRGDRFERPASVADFRAWLVAPPPAPIPAALALRASSRGPVQVFLDLRGVESRCQFVLRRGVGFRPITAAEGQLVAQGPLRTSVEDVAEGLADIPSAALHYAVFARTEADGTASHSVATAVDVVENTPRDILGWAEEGPAAGPADAPEPPRLRLLFEALDADELAEILLASRLPQVRTWTVRRLGRLGGDLPEAMPLWRALHDPVPAVRLEAVRAILRGAWPPASLVRRVVEVLGGDDIDDAIQAARSLRQAGVADDLVRQTVAALEQERPVLCPVCGVNLLDRDRPVHMIAGHGYVDVFGALLPRAEALARLWEQTFAGADAAAHGRLCELLLGEPPSARPRETTADGAGERSPAAYVAALEAELRRRADALLAGRWRDLPRLVACLRESATARPYFGRLLASDDPRVREIGVESVLPELGEHLAGEEVTAKDVRRAIDRVCPTGRVEEKIQLCLRLPHAGVDAVAAEECLRGLQRERPVACPECGAAVTQRELPGHLRRVHRVYEFRGVRRSLGDTLTALLSAVGGTSPDFEAWQTLAEIAAEQFGEEADKFLTTHLAATLRAVPRGQRMQAVAAVAEAAAAHDGGTRLAGALGAAAAQPEAHQSVAALVMELAARLPAPLPPTLVEAVRPLLATSRVPIEARLDGAAALLRTTGREGEPALHVLRALVGETGKAKAVERLALLEQRVGNSAAIEELSNELADQIRMACPRCGAELTGPAMREHVWKEHRLVLDGRRVREPWRLIEDWVEDYRLEKEGAVLDRCRELAQRLDPGGGLFRLQRLLLAHGVEDAEARRAVVGEAGRQGTSVCPHCFALVPLRREAEPPELSAWRGRLSGCGYRVEVSEIGLVPWLEVETPRRTIYEGPEPGRWLTQKGALVLLAGLPVLTALLLACALPLFGLPDLPAVLTLLGMAVVTGWLVSSRWPSPPDPLERAVDFAWDKLVPRVAARGLAASDLAFLGGLARFSAGRGDPYRRRDTLEAAREALEEAVADGADARKHLAALWRLAAEDAAREGADAAAVVAAQAGRCFDGKLPLSFAGQMLRDWEAARWTPSIRARLRVLLCDRAFEAGLEVQDLEEIGRVVPALGAALQTEDPVGLAHLRLLWSLRPTRPWDRYGQAATAFEIAADHDLGRARLGKWPDLLLWVEGTPPMQLCVRGVAFMDKVFPQPVRTIEVVSRHLFQDKGYDLVLDREYFRFPADPEPAARRLEKFFRYFFHEFRPQVPGVARWRSPAVSKMLRTHNAVPCPECHRPVLARPGEVGLSMEVADDLAPPARTAG
jgi:hypothetical protein